MKAALKTLIQGTLGRRRFVVIREWFRRRGAAFSEIDLMEDHFASRRLPGLMLDVGARHGESLMAYQCRHWRVLAFEPDPANRAILETKVDPAFVEIMPVAVSDRESPGVAFYASPESDGVSSLSAFLESHREIAKVPMVTLQAVLQARPEIQEVTFLKIDTEGHDLFVLRGFPWSRFRPELVTCEFDDQKTVLLGYDFHDMGKFLLGQGYRVFVSEWAPIVRYGDTHTWRRWVEYPCELLEPKGWGNFLAFLPGVDLGQVEAYVARFNRANKL